MFTGHGFLKLGAVGAALVLAQGSLAQTVPGMMVVTAYGAKGNGVTDDTKAIQAAVNAAEALPGCGTISFPSGSYVINTGPIVVNHVGCLLRGEAGLSEGASNGGAILLTDTAGQDIIQVNNGGSGVTYPAPAFQNLNFFARSNMRTQKLLHIINANQGHIAHCSFYGGLAGVYLEGANDSSNWTIDGGSIFDGNIVGVDNAGTGGQNIVAHSYIINRESGDIGVRWQEGSGGGGRVTGVHFTPGGYANTGPAVWTGGDQTLIAFNDFESYAPAVVASHAGGGNNGRGTRIIGNYVIGDCTYTHGYGSAWKVDPALAQAAEPAIISLNTYECTSNTDGQ